MTHALTPQQTRTAAAPPAAGASGTITPLRRTPGRLVVIMLLVVVAAVPWRRGAYYAGGLDAVVLGKATMTMLALALVLTAVPRGVPWSRLRAGPVPWLAAYLVLATIGASLGGDAVPSVVLTVRLGLLTLVLVLLFRRYPKDLVLSALTTAMLLLAGTSAATGVGSLAERGRLYGGVPPLNANELAALVSVPLLCLLWRLLQQEARPRELALLPALVAVLWATGARTGLAAVLVAALLMVAMTPRLPRIVAGAGLVAAPAVLYLAFWTPVLSGYATRGDAAGVLTLNSRTVAWQAALDYPDTLVERLLGVGLAVKVIPVSAMYRTEQLLDSTWVSALVQAGLVGACLLALLVLNALFRALVAPRPERSLLVGVLAMLTIRSVLESGLFDTSVSFIAFFCFAMAAQEVVGRRRR